MINRSCYAPIGIKKIAEGGASGGQFTALWQAPPAAMSADRESGRWRNCGWQPDRYLVLGSDVRFEIGSGVEVSLNRAVGVDGEKVTRPVMLPGYTAPGLVITSPAGPR